MMEEEEQPERKNVCWRVQPWSREEGSDRRYLLTGISSLSPDIIVTLVEIDLLVAPLKASLLLSL